LPIKKDVSTLSPKAFTRYVEWQAWDLAKKLFLVSFVFINLLALVLSFKKIGVNFESSFISDVRWAWRGMWALVGGTKLFDFIFRRKK